MKKTIAFIAVCIALTGSLFAEDRSPQSLYDAAIVELSKNTGESKASAVELFKLSAAGFESSASSDYRHWFDAGTARLCAEESALAILDLRRFLARDYFRAEAWDNLAEARKAAQTRSPGGEGPSVWPWSLWFLNAAALSLGLALLSLGVFGFTRKKNFLSFDVPHCRYYRSLFRRNCGESCRPGAACRSTSGHAGPERRRGCVCSAAGLPPGKQGRKHGLSEQGETGSVSKSGPISPGFPGIRSK